MRPCTFLLGLAILASVARASTITDFSATSSGEDFTMHLVGTDDLGNSIDVTDVPDDLGAYPLCTCAAPVSHKSSA
jgi:hypothetical protein